MCWYATHVSGTGNSAPHREVSIMNKTATTSTNTTRRPSNAQAQATETKQEKAIRYGRAVAQGLMIIALAGIGFLGSFQHLRDLGILAGGGALTWYGTANLTPISVDLMLIMASIQLRRKGISDVARLIARLCSISGLALSIAGNVLVAWLSLPADANALRVAYTLVWAAVPVLSLMGAVEMLTHTRKDRPTVSRVASRKPKAAKACAPARTRRTAEATA